MRVPWGCQAGGALISPTPRAERGWVAEAATAQPAPQELAGSRFNPFHPKCESPSSAPPCCIPRVPAAEPCDAKSSRSRSLEGTAPSCPLSLQGHGQVMGSRGDPQGWQPAGLPASFMDGEGLRDTPGRVQAMDIRQGNASSVPSAGDGMWGHREGQHFGLQPILSRAAGPCWCGSKVRFPFNTLQREGMSKTTGILGKLSHCFLSLPSILGYF